MMLRWALVFLMLAIAAAFLRFGSLAPTSAGVATILLNLFLLGFVVSLITGLASAKRPPAV